MKMNMGKEKVGSSSNNLRLQRASFCKIYLPELHSQRLHLNGTIPKNVRLTNLEGGEWRVKLEGGKGKRVYITDGWEEYKVNHSLVPGDFLVFEPLPSYDFYVQVFGTNGSMKEEPLPKSVDFDQFPKTDKLPTGRVIKTGPISAGDDAAYLYFSKIFRNTSKCFMGVPKSVLDQCDYTLPQSIVLRNEKGHAKEIWLRETANRVVMGCKGMTQFWQNSKVREGDTLDFEVILGDGRKIKEFRFEISRSLRSEEVMSK